MDSAISDSPLCFIHLMKTAGASTREYLEAQFDFNSICQAWNPEDFALKSNEEITKYQLYCGHIMGIQLNKLPCDTEYFTIVRNPASRIQSAYKWLRSINKNYWYEARKVANKRGKNLAIADTSKSSANRCMQLAKEYDFFNFIKSNDEDLKPWLTNLTLHQLAFDGSNKSEFEDQNSLDIQIHYMHSMEILDNCITVGMQECLQKSMELLCYKRKWPAPPILLRIHRTGFKKNMLGDKEIEIIKSRNKIDYMIYENISSRFDSEYVKLVENAGGISHIREYLNNNHRKTVFERLLPQNDLVLDAQNAWPGIGWGMREFDKNRRFWRHIGDTGRASVLAKLLPHKNYTVKIYMRFPPYVGRILSLTSINKTIRKHCVRFECNNTNLSILNIKHENNHILIESYIYKNNISDNGCIEFEISVPQLFVMNISTTAVSRIIFTPN